MTDTYGLKNLIGNSSDQFKSDFINKINNALKKLDGVGYSTPVSATGEPVGMSVASPKKSGTTSDISDVAYAMETPKAKKKKEEKIEKILGDKSIYANVTNKKTKLQEKKEEEKAEKNFEDYKEGQNFWWKILNKVGDKIQKNKNDKINKEKALAGTYKTSDDMNLYVPNTYTGSSDIKKYPADSKYLEKGEKYRNYIDDLEELYQYRLDIENRYDRLNKEMLDNQPNLGKNYAVDGKALGYESWEDWASAVSNARSEYGKARDELYRQEKEELEYIDDIIDKFVNFGKQLNISNYRMKTPSGTLKYDLDAFYNYLENTENRYQKRSEFLDSLYL